MRINSIRIEILRDNGTTVIQGFANEPVLKNATAWLEDMEKNEELHIAQAPKSAPWKGEGTNP